MRRFENLYSLRITISPFSDLVSFLSEREIPLVLPTVKHLTIDCRPGLDWLELCPNALNLDIKCIERYQNRCSCDITSKLSHLADSRFSTEI